MKFSCKALAASACAAAGAALTLAAGGTLKQAFIGAAISNAVRDFAIYGSPMILRTQATALAVPLSA